ncbi:BspA family leucine-rich repeat surface protein [Candidatus Saccharibacteria bacterium]|nr:BspA family leucine-rich repeat surface protein [Candidatus Saccharibacteria bacterium]
MKGHIIIRDNYRNILVVLPALFIMLFAAAIMFPVVSESTHAEGDVPEEGISITISDPVSANLVLFDEGDYKIAKDTVQVSSSAPYGYELYLSTDSEEHQSIYLNNDPTSTSVISPVSGTIAEPAVLTSNTWGFAIAGQGNFDDEYNTTSPNPNSHFAIIPTTNDQAVYENNSATADDDIDFYYGIKIEPTLEAGEYTTSASYTAIAKIPPLTAKATLKNGSLTFFYDRERHPDSYKVPLDAQCTDETRMGWYRSSRSIGSVVIDSSFADARPTSTCAWFSYLPISGISGASNLKTDNVVDMSYMFSHIRELGNNFELHLENTNWNTSNVKNMSHMFEYAGYSAVYTWNISGIDEWDTGNVTNMSHMFDHATYSVTSDPILGGGGAIQFANIFKGWNVDNVTDMSYMFAYTGYNSNVGFWDRRESSKLSNWNTSKVQNMSGMFAYADYNSNASSWTADLSWLKTDSATDMSYMFDHARYSTTRGATVSFRNFNTSNVTNMSHMFDHFLYSQTSGFNVGLSGWDTSKVINMSHMFDHAGYSAGSFQLVFRWDTSKVTDMSYMFYNAGYNATEWAVDLVKPDYDPGWDVSSVVDHADFMNLNANGTNADFVNNQPNWPQI